MIIFIDTNSRKIKAYSSKGSASASFEDSESLLKKLKTVKEEILLIKKATKTNVDELSNIISKLSNQKPTKKQKRKSYSKDEELYVHFIGPGGLSLNELDNITFQNPVDFKPLRELVAIGLQDAEACKGLMRSGKLEVMSADEMQSFVSDWYQSKDEDRIKDEELDGILVDRDTKAEDFVDKVSSEGMFDDPRTDNAIDIDLNKSMFGSGGGASGGRGNNENSLVSEEDAMGLGGSSVGGNEGGMLPEDFDG